MTPSIILAPSILDADFTRLGDAIHTIEAGGADWVHLDVMDGQFVPNISFGLPVVRDVRKITKLPLDAHLMIENPERYIEAFVQAGANIVTVHAETGYHLQRTLSQIRALGARAGVALNPGSPLALIEDVLDDVDLILIMSVNPGFGGQKFIPRALNRIERLREMLLARQSPAIIQVDGGIEPTKTAPAVIRAGATSLVAGSAIFKASDGPAAALAAFRQAAARAHTIQV